MSVSVTDTEGMQGLVSEEFSDWTEPMEITQEMVNTFADVTDDHQWIHVDIERANAGPFGGPIAHGFFTLSLMASIIQLAPFEGVSNGVNYGANKLRFLSPVPGPSTLHGRSRIVKSEKKGPGTLITSEATIHVVGNDKPAVLYEMLTLLM